jgi:hypothetical protein
VTVTICGRVVDALGHCQRKDITVESPTRVRAETRSFALPAAGFRRVQPETIGLDWNHGPLIGQVLALERRDGALWATAESEHDELLDVDEPLYFSVEATHVDGDDIELRGLALTWHPAAIAQQPIEIITGNLRHAVQQHRAGPTRDRLQRALDAHRRRRRNDPIVVEGIDDTLGVSQSREPLDVSVRRQGPITHLWHSPTCQCALRRS